MLTFCSYTATVLGFSFCRTSKYLVRLHLARLLWCIKLLGVPVPAIERAQDTGACMNRVCVTV